MDVGRRIGIERGRPAPADSRRRKGRALCCVKELKMSEGDFFIGGEGLTPGVANAGHDRRPCELNCGQRGRGQIYRGNVNT